MKLKEVQLVTIDGRHYILSDDSNSELFVFSIDDQLTVAYFDELLGDTIQWVKPVLIEPDNIGWVNEGVNENINGEDVYKLTFLSNHHLEIIKSNNGICKIEVDEIDVDLISDFDPTIHTSFKPIYHHSKVIIHL
jgi:hypothetical protein